jgi:hypothetical protein
VSEKSKRKERKRAMSISLSEEDVCISEPDNKTNCEIRYHLDHALTEEKMKEREEKKEKEKEKGEVDH